ncbi:MAG: O-antigen ligase family protein [Chitinispirillaceae bacterium]
MLGEKKKVSVAMWLPLLWMLRCGSRSLAYWLDPQLTMAADDFMTGNPYDRNFFLALEFLGVLVLLWRRFDLIYFIRHNIWVVLLFVYMLSSLLWSDFPDISIRRWARALGDILMVLVVVTESDVPAAYNWMVRRFAYVLVPLSVMLVKYFREIGVAYDFTGDMEMWVGVTTHKNSLGQLVTLSLLFFVWQFLRRKWSYFDIPIVIGALWLLGGSGTASSKTSILVFLTGTAMFVALSRLKNAKVLVVGFCSVLVTAFIGEVILEFFLHTSIFELVLSTTGRDATLTGRTDLWVEVIRIGMQHPFLGSGYGNFWLGDFSHNLWDIFNWHPAQAHNGYIDVFVDIGFIGLFLVVMLVLWGIRSSFREISRGSEFGKFRLVIILMVVIYNIAESSFAKPTSLLWFTFLIMAMNDPESRRETEAMQQSSSEEEGDLEPEGEVDENA